MSMSSGRRGKTSLSFKHGLPAILTLVLGVCASLVMFVLVWGRESEERQRDFESTAQLISDSLQSRFNEYEGTLHFLKDFHYNSVSVERQEFDTFVRGALSRYPAIQALSWNPRVTRDGRDAFERGVRSEGLEAFQIREKGPDGRMTTAGDRELFFPVCYIQPLDRNVKALGYDIASEVVRRQALEKAYETGHPSVSHRVTLVQEKGDQYGILLLLPVFTTDYLPAENGEAFENVRGFVVEVLRVGDVVDDVMSHFPDETMNMSLFDMTAAKDERFLYRKKPKVENGSGSGPEETCAHEVAHPLHIAGKLWEIRFSPALCLKDSFNRYQSISTLIGALLITVLLAYYLHKKMIYTVEIEGAIQAVREANEQLEDEVWIRKHEEAKLITAKKNLESEIRVRTETEKKLTQALAEVKTLRGILPLCSYCKKIRDDKGYWEQVDVYLLKHSQADVSHGICPDCLKRHFPDEYGKMIEEDQSGD